MTFWVGLLLGFQSEFHRFHPASCPLLLQVPGDRAPVDGAHVDVSAAARARRRRLALLGALLAAADRRLQIHGGPTRLRGEFALLHLQHFACRSFVPQPPAEFHANVSCQVRSAAVLWLLQVYDCWATFSPDWTLQFYITFFTVAVYVIPLVLLVAAYGRICYVVFKSMMGREAPPKAVHKDKKYSKNGEQVFGNEWTKPVWNDKSIPLPKRLCWFFKSDFCG